MQSETRDKISSTFLEVVEQLTFMFGMPIPREELPPLEGDAYRTAMTFQGDVSGQLSMVVPVDMTAEIAGNILGLDPEDVHPGVMLTDALKEVLNVVCGHVIMALAGHGANFKLETPSLDKVEAEEWRELLVNDHHCGFLLEESPVLLGLRLD
jgi:hypothetical protein